ncbi:MAG: TIGR03790 family protein [Bacteroidia bacterium]
MNKYYSLLLLLMAFLPGHILAQTNYNDVAVIVNSNSTVSLAIGEYFSQERNIPEKNIIKINVPEKEQISSAEFDDLRQQVEDYITANNLLGDLNYLVTTKGVPLGIARDSSANWGGVPFGYHRASVESELALILGPYAPYIGDSLAIQNPYFQKNEHFTRNKFGVFLVTRLDGYTQQDVFRLVDNGGPSQAVNRDSATFVLDQAPKWNTAGQSYQQLNQRLGQVATVLKANNWETLLNDDTVFVTGQRNVLGYASWGSNDQDAHAVTTWARPGNIWAKGSIAETYVSTSGRSFESSNTIGWQSRIADLVEEGVSAVKGYVYEPFSFALADVSVLFSRYTDEDADEPYNMAESFGMASAVLSWMDVVIGDPKTSLQLKEPSAVAKSGAGPSFRIYPNPAVNEVNIIYPASQPIHVMVQDLMGRRVLQRWIDGGEDYLTLDVSGLSAGTYLVTLNLENTSLRQKLVVR